MSSSAEPAVPSEPPQGSADASVPAQAQSAPAAEPSAADAAPPSHLQAPEPLSKNALKRARKQQAWEAGREDRRLKRREKRLAHKQKVRTERAALVAGGADPRVVYRRDRPPAAPLVPLAIVLDCDFESYMTDKERVSLSSQVTRAYSDNRHASYRAHLWVAGFRGKLAARFDEVLQAQQRHWKGASVFEGDFAACAAAARAQMASFQTVTPASEQEEQEKVAGQHQPANEQLMIGALRRSLENPAPWPRDARDPLPLDEPEPPLDPAFGDVVYLSSDSPYTLTRLEPGTTYVVGGLVDKNREKGIRTARLPIGEYMVMRSRQVLATNHVVAIMLRWLEHEDWGKAFLSVIPKRKGGRLREGAAEGEEGEAEAEEEVEEEEDDGEQAAEGDDSELGDGEAERAGENNNSEQVEVTRKMAGTA
ncbi:tRNA m(1)G methyltransferase domain containing protein [Cordyceps fumosorosea ARSEF 2679]|uniref:tRNA (guanine(9)-N1)-methyltransferase n=1 Tax=Cordyceps fumosorosea (strain ARSEF 2679) TaxID=1081104 RepID=A0A168EBY6_CORFA|nr:tRNA m(1)G methyltransferase domain containing protein [Cordyceps fumosorosea ARSEF 2679]OAA73627.1 tRNA m(1)G methyltransferase domain containing protein [Cordyceps fumosorosea ARSEF 2679]